MKKLKLVIALLAASFSSFAQGEVKRVIHTVEPGQTIYSIARSYQQKPDDILRINPTLGSTYNIKPGQVLTIEIPIVPPTPQVTTPVVDKNTIEHIVVKDDTLYSLSKQYGVSIDDIKSWNNLSDNAIKLEQSLIVGYKYNNTVQAPAVVTNTVETAPVITKPIVVTTATRPVPTTVPVRVTKPVVKTTANTPVVTKPVGTTKPVSTPVATNQSIPQIDDTVVYRVDVNGNIVKDVTPAVGETVANTPAKPITKTPVPTTTTPVVKPSVPAVATPNVTTPVPSTVVTPSKPIATPVSSAPTVTTPVVKKPEVVKPVAPAPVKKLSAQDKLRNKFNTQKKSGSIQTKEGQAIWIVSQNRMMNSTYYGMFSNVSVGTVVKVENLNNGRSVYVKVIGSLPNTKGNTGALIKLTPAVQKALRTSDARVRVKVTYAK